MSGAGADALAAPRLSTRLFFLASGFANAAWAPMVPFVKHHTGLGSAGFGAVLTGLGLGAVLVMPMAAWALRRHGSRRVMAASALLIMILLPLLAILSNPAALALALLGFGFGLGGLDAAMNAQAVEVEMRSRRPLMSGFHGMFSIGGLLGSLGLTLLLAGGLPVEAGAAVVSGLFLLVWLSRLRDLLPGVEPPRSAATQGRRSAALHPRVLLIGGLCFIGFLGEGAALDWSALWLHDKGVPAAYGGLAYATFSVLMAAGRLGGDRLAWRWGAVPLLRASALFAALGWLCAVLLPGIWSVGGFALVGVGASNIVPQLFGAAARVPGVPTSVAIPLVSALGYAGMLCGPALVGFAAAATGLGAALSGVGALLLVVFAAARVVGR